MGPNLVYDGVVLMSAGDWVRHHGADDPLFVVIGLASGADREQTRARLQASLPDDIVVLTPDELRAREVTFTISAAPIGLIFGLGALLGLLVGMIFSYQVLYNEVSDCRAQFTTLRAMGFDSGYFAAVIVTQALLLAALGALLGLLASDAAYRAIAAASHMAMALTVPRAAAITLLTMLFCLGAGLAAARRLQRLEPAELL
jgi:putative ABC transport system permease protein